jgi:hypothetical protein
VTHATAIVSRKRLVIAVGFEVANTVLVQLDCARARDFAGGPLKCQRCSNTSQRGMRELPWGDGYSTLDGTSATET